MLIEIIFIFLKNMNNHKRKLKFKGNRRSGVQIVLNNIHKKYFRSNIDRSDNGYQEITKYNNVHVITVRNCIL